MKYENLNITSHEEKIGYGYYYTVGTFYSHTAFETRAAAITWLQSLGLSIDGELPQKGTFGVFRIKGSYRRELCLCSSEAFEDLAGVPVVVLENGRYTNGKLGIVEGERVLYVANSNCKWAKEYDYKLCRKLKNEGISIF